MKNVKINNTSLKRDLTTILENGTDFKKGNVGGNSIEYRQGNSFSSLVYYNDEKGRDEDLMTIEKLLSSK